MVNIVVSAYINQMARRPYRVEVTYPKKGKPKYFLVRDVKVKGKKRKARKYLGIVPPTAEEVEKYRREYAAEMEIKVAKKKAEMSASFYASEHLSKYQIGLLEELRYTYQGVMDLLTVNELEGYEKQFEISYVHGTTSIEGNTLTLREAGDLLVYRITPESKSLREINEVQNFMSVARYRNKYKGKVTLDFIKTLHNLIMNNIDYESAGSFRRTDDIGIEGYDNMLCPSALIEEELEKAIQQYYEELESGRHPFELAIIFHHEFEVIHPFSDGNGRVGREILNYMLMRTKFPKLLFLGEDRGEYINALKLGDENRYSDMVGKFYYIIMKQRYGILRENLESIAKTAKRDRQLRLSHFIKT